MKIVVWSNPTTGRMGQAIPTYGAAHGLSDEQLITRTYDKWVARGMENVQIIEATGADDEVDGGRYFRNAWEVVDGARVANRTKAETVKMERIRRVRNRQLGVEDINWNRANGDDAKAVVETERQRLRDIPATFDISTSAFPSIENLKAAWPDLTSEPEDE